MIYGAMNSKLELTGIDKLIAKNLSASQPALQA
jgi:hypothetical protein